MCLCVQTDTDSTLLHSSLLHQLRLPIIVDMSQILYVLIFALWGVLQTTAVRAEYCSIESGTIHAQNYSSLEDLQQRCLYEIRVNPRYGHFEFLGLILVNISLGRLPNDAFKGLRFRKLLLTDCKLSSMAPGVLGDSALDIKQLIIRTNTPNNEQCPTLTTSFLREIRNWRQLELLELCITSTTVLSGGAFSHLGQLQTLKFYGHGARASFVIERNAFSSLPLFRLLILHRIQLLSVANEAFVFGHTTTTPSVSLMFIRCEVDYAHNFGSNTIVTNSGDGDDKTANFPSVEVFINPETSIKGDDIVKFEQLLAHSSKSHLYVSRAECGNLTSPQQRWLHQLVEKSQVRLKCLDRQALPTLELDQHQQSVATTVTSKQSEPSLVLQYKADEPPIEVDQIFTLLEQNDLTEYERLNPLLRDEMIKNFWAVIETMKPTSCLEQQQHPQRCSRLLRVVDELPVLYLQHNNRTYLQTKHFHSQVISGQSLRSAEVAISELEEPQDYYLLLNHLIFAENNSIFGGAAGEQLNSDIISATVVNKESFEREHNVSVTIYFTNRVERQFSDHVRCVFWNFRQQRWSDEGCSFEWRQSNRTTTVCHCNHLTNFAALLDVRGREDNDRIKSALTYIFCGLSIFCFFASICISYRMARVEKFTLANDQFRCRSNKYILNLNIAFCLLMTNFLTVAGLDRREVRSVCVSISITLVFFLLSSFSFMLLQGYHLLRSTLNPLANDYRFRSYFLLGYGMPMAILITSILIVWCKDHVFLDLFIGDFL